MRHLIRFVTIPVELLSSKFSQLLQINSMQANDSEGPAWNKFWSALENETESVMSGDGSHVRAPMTPDARSHMSHEPSTATGGGAGRPHHERGDSVLPNESASHHGADSPDHSAITGQASPLVTETPFAFKFRAPGGRMHRLQVTASAGVAELVASVAQKLGTDEAEGIGGVPELEDGGLKGGFALSYLDNEGDSVSITTDRDLLEAVEIAARARRDKVDLFVHHPDKPPLPATVDPQPALPAKIASPEREAEGGAARRRKGLVAESEEELEDDAAGEAEEVVPRRKRAGAGQQVQALIKGGGQQEQIIQGIPNDMLLPGAAVALAVVIVGVFALGRATSR